MILSSLSCYEKSPQRSSSMSSSIVLQSFFCLASISKVIHYCRWRRFSCILGWENRHLDAHDDCWCILSWKDGYRCCDLQTLLTEDKWLTSRWWSKMGAWRWAGLTKEQRRPFTKCSSGEGFRGTGTFWKRPHKAALTNGPQRVRGSLQDIWPPPPARLPPIVCLGKGSWGEE